MTMKSSPLLKAWGIVLVASLFFFYEFIQMNMFNAMSFALIKAFSIDAEKLGLLSSFYFIANVIFLFPAGAILDRFSTRKVILTTLFICMVGIVSFSLTTSFAWAIVARFLMGIGSAFCFLSVIRLASRWFPANRMAFVTGAIVTMAMLGGMVAQTPLTLMMQVMTWRQMLWFDAGLGCLVFLLIAFFVKDYPVHHQEIHRYEQQQIRSINFLTSLKMAFAKKQNWLCGIYTALMNLPIGLLGGLWGSLYLVSAHHVTKVQASDISSMLFLGCVIGAPIVGFISDRLGMRRPPMFVGAVLSLVLFLIIISPHNLNIPELIILFLTIGIVTSTQIISYPLVAESSLRMITAMSVSVVNISVQGSSAIFQPFFGFLVDMHAKMRGGVTTLLAPADFHWAIILFPLGFVLAFIAVIAMRETYCQLSTENDVDDETSLLNSIAH